MRDIVLLLDFRGSASAAAYDTAARSLGLLPLRVTRDAVRKRDSGVSDLLPVASWDMGSILAALDRLGPERVAGVFAGESSRSELAARLAVTLGRPHADPDAIALCEEKHRLRAFLARTDFNAVDCRHVATLSDAREAAETLAGAVVLKPTVSMGSEGARICRTPDEAVLHAKRLLKWNPQGFLVEKFIDAPQYAVEMFDGEPLIVRRSYIADGPAPIVVGIDAPAALPAAQAHALENYAAAVVKEVGLTSGPCFVELRSSGADIYLVEINPRPALSDLGWPAELAKRHLQFVCGIPYSPTLAGGALGGHAYAARHVVRKGSSVRAVDGLDEAREVPGVSRVDVYGSSFRRRGAATSSLDWLVTVHSQADSLDSAVAAAETAIEKLRVAYNRFPMDLIRYHAGKIRRLGMKASDTLRLLLDRR